MITSPIDPNLDQLQSMAALQEHRFHSRVPLIGPLIVRFRELWNSVSTRWYVRPLIQQQSEFNERIVALMATQAAVLRAAENQRAQGEARLARHDEQLANTEALLARYEERLTACEARSGHSEAHLSDQETRLHDHDGWLIEQDREQSATIADLNDTALRLIQTGRRLAELEQRLAALESESASDATQQAR
jgi:hypothetical protein